MPPIEQHGLYQKATYWEFLRTDKYGKPVVKLPVEIDCRYTEGETDKNTTKDGSVSVTSSLQTAMELTVKSIVRVGDMGSIPDPPDKLLTVVSVRRGTDVKGRSVKHSSNLSKYSDSLPEIVNE